MKDLNAEKLDSIVDYLEVCVESLELHLKSSPTLFKRIVKDLKMKIIPLFKEFLNYDENDKHSVI